MTSPLRHLLHPYCADATDGAAELVLVDISPSHRRLVAFRGKLEGPFCVRARTLRTVYPIESTHAPHEILSAVALVTDPCYWTPELPFIYELTFTCEFADGSTEEIQDSLGLRRWQTRGASFFMNGKRVVLRGAVRDSEDVDWQASVRAETALVVPASPAAPLSEASRLGVPAIVDFRGALTDPYMQMREFAWEPSVVAAIFAESDESLARVGWPPVAVAAAADVQAAERLQASDRVLVAELNGVDKPPAWSAFSDRPVIAIRRGVSYADFHEARAACDRLQADLAPAFDLAGYFVAR